MPVVNRSVSWVDLRQAAIWRGLSEALGEIGPGGRLVVVDAGGGSGGFAVPLAERGHDVTVVDPSPDALASLGRRAAERGVAELIHGRQGDLTNLLEVVPPGGADLVLCHSVLEFVDAPADALVTAVAALHPGGLLSVLAANRVAAVLARAVAGKFTDAAAVLGPEAGAHAAAARQSGSPAARWFDVAGLTDLVTRAGADVRVVHGVRVFADLVPSALAEADQAAEEALLRLELAASSLAPYVDIATQLHLLAVSRPEP